MSRASCVVAALVALASCGPRVEEEVPSSAADAGLEAGEAGDAVGDGGRDAPPIGLAFGDGGCASPCPVAVPREGSACTRASLECEYGGAFDARCNTVARCESTLRWSITAPHGSCPTSAGDACPSSPFGPERGKPCSVEGQVCPYTDGVCDCQREAGDAGGPVWACAVFTCMGPRARLGCACSGALSCEHGGCDGELANGIDVACRDGVWTRPDACR